MTCTGVPLSSSIAKLPTGFGSRYLEAAACSTHSLHTINLDDLPHAFFLLPARSPTSHQRSFFSTRRHGTARHDTTRCTGGKDFMVRVPAQRLAPLLRLPPGTKTAIFARLNILGVVFEEPFSHFFFISFGHGGSGKLNSANKQNILFL